MISLTKPYIDEEIKAELVRIIFKHDLESFIYVEKFTKEFLEYSDMKYGVCFNSGTSALIVCLTALGLREGDRVITPAYTCKAILDALVLLKLKPVFVDNYLDYGKSNFNLDENDFLAKNNGSVSAAILPYMFGNIHKYKKLFNSGIPVIEDITLSLGADLTRQNIKDRIIISSFHQSKVVSAFEGGIFTTNNKRIYQKAVVLSNTVEINKKERMQNLSKINYNMSYSFRPSELNFIFGYLQIKKMGEFIKKRQEIAKFYINSLNSTKYIIPEFDPKNSYFRFIAGIKNGKIEAILKYLLNEGIEAGRGVYPPLNVYGFGKGNIKNAEKAVNYSLSIPLYPALTLDQRRFIVNVLNKYEN